MPVEKLHIKEFLGLADRYPVLDVRSPSEYKHAHIPGAFSLPLFTDEERKIVGTIYKQESRQHAIKSGLDFFGPKMRSIVEEVEEIVSNSLLAVGNKQKPEAQISKCVLVHCWRGGMRSSGVAWLLDLFGFTVFSLIGGYKAYRNYVTKTINRSYNFKILGGYTGSGKTMVLKELENKGEKIIDLEGIACHKGSAFGAIGQPPQPGQEMFENLVCCELTKFTNFNDADGKLNPIWLEDESQRIGSINLPQVLWENMRQSTVFFIDIPFEERLNYVVECYGQLDKEQMIDAISRIRKRLGGLEMKLAINYLLENNERECFRILLKYYDKYYLKGLNTREDPDALVKTITGEKVDAAMNAASVLEFYKSTTAKIFDHE